MSADQKRKLARAVDTVRELPLEIDDRPALTLSKIAARARRLKSRRGLALIVIDYLSLIDGQKQKGENRQDEVARLSKGLKTMVRQLDTPLLCVHQLNRENEKREKGKHRPRLSDLRESGQIEQDADMVLLLHRPEYYDPND
jgi:replicative DNA helicase